MNRSLTRFTALALGSLVLAGCAPAAKDSPNFSGVLTPATTTVTYKSGLCANYAAHYARVGQETFPVPLGQGELWSYLIPVRQDTNSNAALLTSKNNSRNTANLYVEVSCVQQGNQAQLTVKSSGPVSTTILKDLNSRFLAAL